MIGKIPDDMREAVFETIPIEFSILDKDDNVVGWNNHETRIFKRPVGVVGRNVRKCHPQKSLAKVEQILAEMKTGKRDKARFWIKLPFPGDDTKHTILIEYYALRDSQDRYLGCLEASQDITDLRKITGEKRLLE